MLTQPLLNTLFSEMPGVVDFTPRRCLRSRFNKNMCRRCLDVCQAKGLRLQGRQIIFTGAECTGCMQCVAVCPNDAFMHSIDYLRIVEGMAGADAVILSCAKERVYRNQVTLPCIGSLSEVVLAVMNTVVRGHAFIDVSRCQDCVNSHCLRPLHANLQGLTHTMQNKGELRLTCLDGQQEELSASVQMKRRSFLQFMGKTFSDVGRRSLPSQPPRTEAVPRLSSKGQVQSNAVLQYGLKTAVGERGCEREGLLAYFFTVCANGQCDCCPACTGMCPTGALKRQKNEEKTRLMFTSSHCTGCGLCVEFCRKSALTLHGGFSGDTQPPVVIVEKNAGQDAEAVLVESV